MKKNRKSIECTRNWCCSTDPAVTAASGVDEQVVAQANLSEEKNIQELLGDENETENSVGRDD